MNPINQFFKESVWYSKPMKNVVDDPKWQIIRKSLLGKWSKEYIKCCQILRNYVGNMKDIRKVRQVYNYLTGTYFRTHKNPECVIKLRNDIKEAKKKFKTVHMENEQI